MSGRLLTSTRRIGMRAALLAAGSSVLVVASASASTHTFTVKTKSDAVHGSCGSKCSLRDAVIAADKAGGTSIIKLPAGTYKLTIAATSAGGNDDPAQGDLDIKTGAKVTVEGAGASKTFIDGGDADRLFAVHKGAALTVSGVTAEKGDESDDPPSDYGIEGGYGGAFYNDGSLTINKSILTRNTAEDGGAVIYTDEDATSTSINDSSVTMNSADDEGGVIYAYHGKISLSGDTIEQNYADDGGGVVYAYDTKAPITVAGTKIEYNDADDEGGAIYAYNTGAISISKSTLSGNIADDEGGALYADETGKVAITGSALDDNFADDDGSVFSIEDAGAVTLSKDTMNGNIGTDDGGFGYLYESGATSISHSVFSHDVSQDDDGNLYADDSGRITISSSSFTDDNAYSGGAVYTDATDLTVTGSHFTADNSEYGGALYLDGSSGTAAQNITGSTFVGDQATDDEGGAIYDDSGDLSVKGSTFYRNSSTYYGGALYYESGDGLSLVNDTFDSNTSNEGGAVYLDEGASAPATIDLLNDTIARNVGFFGGGIAYPYEANSIENTIIVDNVGTPRDGAPTGSSDCYYALGYSSSTADAGHNLASNRSCFAGGSNGDKISSSPKLGPLQNNGGPVPTDALLSGSPAIGAADSAACPKTDARGVKRTGKCSIGAYQAAAKKK